MLSYVNFTVIQLAPFAPSRLRLCATTSFNPKLASEERFFVRFWYLLSFDMPSPATIVYIITTFRGCFAQFM